MWDICTANDITGPEAGDCEQMSKYVEIYLCRTYNTYIATIYTCQIIEALNTWALPCLSLWFCYSKNNKNSHHLKVTWTCLHSFFFNRRHCTHVVVELRSVNINILLRKVAPVLRGIYSFYVQVLWRDLFNVYFTRTLLFIKHDIMLANTS